MIDTYDVKDSMRQTDIIWDTYNKLSIGKQTGGLGEFEFSDLLTNIGDVFANQVRRGKVNEETIESYKSHISHLLGQNRDKFYSYPHKGLERAGKTSYESIEIANGDLEQRNLEAQPVKSPDSYEKAYRKLGS